MSHKKDDADSEHPKAMRIPADAPPGIELDNHGRPVPLAERTEDDKEKVEQAIGNAVASTRDGG